MANFTKKAIKDTFIALLEEYPISEITVKTFWDKSDTRYDRHSKHFLIYEKSPLQIDHGKGCSF